MRGGVGKRRAEHQAILQRMARRILEIGRAERFQELNNVLKAYLNDVTLKVIREEIHTDTSEAAEIAGALPSGGDGPASKI